VYRSLVTAWEELDDPAVPEPPAPLILNGWAFSDDAAKKRRWTATVRWASEWGVSELIPRFGDGELHFGEPQ
jgi:hypothetical protein